MLFRSLSGAINGASIARGTSFLKDKLGEKIFADGITIIDDPLRKRGLRSSPFDAEGIAGKVHKLIDGGRLTTWILDCATARELGMTTTGHAHRGVSSTPSPGASNRAIVASPDCDTPRPPNTCATVRPRMRRSNANDRWST